MQRDPSEGADLARARERFLDSGALPRAGVRAEIAASWERSRLAGIDATRFAVPYVDDLDFDGGLARCARPVLDGLAETLSGMAVAVVLTDTEGRLLDRRVGDPGLARRLDAISLAPGFTYAEEFAGTNGVGTALSDGTASLVVGAEHFTDRLQPFACAGAPVLGVDGTLAGILDVTCLREHASGLMRVLAARAASDIGDALRERGSAGAHAVMATFRATCARHAGPVLAIGARGAGGSLDQEFVVANGAARHGLSLADQDALAALAADRLGDGPRGAGEERALLGCGPVRLLVTPVPPAHPVGVVVAVVPSASTLRLAPAGGGARGRDVATRPLSGLAGSSGAWRAVVGALRAAAAQRRPVAVLGEPGVGKTAAVRAVHDEARPDARWVVVDAAAGASDPAGELAALPALLADAAATVVVRGLDAAGTADTATAEALAELVEDAPGSWWVVGLVTGPATTSPAALPGPPVVVAPLRRRPRDVDDLVPVLLDRLAPGRGLRCAAATSARLAGGRWPGNVRELAAVLRVAATAAAARSATVIEPGDLPDDLVVHGPRRRLSPLETAERDLIVSALLDAGGNRARAAAALGMGRTTLYRRLRAFGLTDLGR